MIRNLYHRVETCFPIVEDDKKRVIQEGLMTYLENDRGAWLCGSDAEYHRVTDSKTAHLSPSRCSDCAIGRGLGCQRQMETNMAKELTGKCALVTGGSGEIGRALCVRLAECGAEAFHVLSNHDGAEENIEGH